jgi:hypothetical protein
MVNIRVCPWFPFIYPLTAFRYKTNLHLWPITPTPFYIAFSLEKGSDIYNPIILLGKFAQCQTQIHLDVAPAPGQCV